MSSAFQVAFITGVDVLADLHEETEIKPNSVDFDVISFSDLGFDNWISLYGPYQEFSIKFSLPPDWQVEESFSIEMEVESEFQPLLEAFSTEEFTEGLSFQKGTLGAKINNVGIGEFEIFESGNNIVSFTAPGTLINQNTKENELIISWDSSAACDHSITTTISINKESEIRIPHTLRKSLLKLTDFPSPFLFNNSFAPNPIAFVIPYDVNEDTLSALLAVSGAFGKISGGDLTYEILNAGDLDKKHLGIIIL